MNFLDEASLPSLPLKRAMQNDGKMAGTRGIGMNYSNRPLALALLQNFIGIFGVGQRKRDLRVPRWTDFPVVGRGNTGELPMGFPDQTMIKIPGS